MSNSTFFGQSEIFWTAMEAIGTIGAVLLTICILFIQRIRAYLYSPNIVASDPKLDYTPPFLASGERGEIRLSWNIQNKSRFGIFGSIAVNIITRYWFDKKEHEGWSYSSTMKPLPILPKNEKWKQHTGILLGELEVTKYTLILVFYQTSLKEKDKEEVIGYAEFDIPYKVLLHRLKI